MNRKQLKRLMLQDRERFYGYVGSTSISWWVTSSYRRGQYLLSKSRNPLYKSLLRVYQVYYYFVKLITGIQLPLSTEIGGGYYSHIIL